MKNKLTAITFTCIISSLLLFSCTGSKDSTESQSSTTQLTSEKDSASWIIGTQIAENLRQQKLDTKLNKAAILAGIEAQLNSDSTLVGMQEGNEIVGQYFEKLAKEESKVKIEEGEKFLAENGKRSEVTTTPSGLQYEILVKGEGAIPTSSSKVKTHYKGTLLDGTVFDSSYDRGQPLEFNVTGVIKGWIEALQMMPVGSKWKLYIPYNLAYGERGTRGAIGPYETLIFEIELIDIVK